MCKNCYSLLFCLFCVPFVSDLCAEHVSSCRAYTHTYVMDYFPIIFLFIICVYVNVGYLLLRNAHRVQTAILKNITTQTNMCVRKCDGLILRLGTSCDSVFYQKIIASSPRTQTDSAKRKTNKGG